MFKSFILLAFASLTAFSETNELPIRSTKAIRALSLQDIRRQVPVELKGQIVARLFNGGRILQDETGGYVLETKSCESPNVGDIVALKGTTTADPFSQTYIHYTNLEILGSGEVSAPRPVNAADITSGRENYNLVTIPCIISAVIPDEDNRLWNWLVVRDHHGEFVYVAVPDAGTADLSLESLTDAEVEITGMAMPHYSVQRRFLGPHLEVWSRDCIRLIRSPPPHPFSAAYLPAIECSSPHEIVRMRRHRVMGRVLAAWKPNECLLKETDGRLIEVDLSDGQPLPRAGEHIEAVGLPSTDLFRITLVRAHCRPTPGYAFEADQCPASAVNAKDILTDANGNKQLQQKFHGKVVTLTGIVRSLPSPVDADGRMNLDCEGYLAPVDFSANPNVTEELSIGCRIEATGICILKTDKWSPTNPFPVLGGFTLVLRTPADIRVLSRPSWWTPARLVIVICSLLAALIAVFVWNRFLGRLVERRSRQLFKEQIAHADMSLKIGERTRLAVELHDSLSQNLAGLACQISAAKSSLTLAPALAAKYLNTAEQMLLSSRTELRRCLWDLRGDTLEIADMAEAVTKTVKPVIGKAALVVRFNVPRTRLLDSTAHAILCIVRELAANATRHGHATQIRVAGVLYGSTLLFSVHDNGTGFDVNSHPGIAEGHFGLSGIRERVERLNGTLSIVSTARGTKARIVLTVPHPTDTDDK